MPMSMLSVAVGKMLTMCRRDDDRQVAMAILEALNDMLKDIGQPVLNCLERPDTIIAIIKDVFQQKVCIIPNLYFMLCFISFISFMN